MVDWIVSVFVGGSDIVDIEIEAEVEAVVAEGCAAGN